MSHKCALSYVLISDKGKRSWGQLGGSVDGSVGLSIDQSLSELDNQSVREPVGQSVFCLSLVLGQPEIHSWGTPPLEKEIIRPLFNG